MPTAIEETVHFLRHDEDVSHSVRALLFGELMKLAAPRVQHYHCDLYHDAHWIGENVSEPTTFYFGADNCGTAIGTIQEYINRKNVWRVTLVGENGKYFAAIRQIAGEEKS